MYSIKITLFSLYFKNWHSKHKTHELKRLRVLSLFSSSLVPCKGLLIRRFRKFAKKGTFIFVISVCLSACPSVCLLVHLSVRMEQPLSHSKDFNEISYLQISRKSFGKIQVSLKCYKNNGYFVSGPVCICNNISLIYF